MLVSMFVKVISHFMNKHCVVLSPKKKRTKIPNSSQRQPYHVRSLITPNHIRFHIVDDHTKNDFLVDSTSN